MSDFTNPVLRRNLLAIQQRNAELAERVCLPVGGDHVRVRPDGHVEYRIHRTWHGLEPSSETCDRMLAELGDATRILLFGLGLGGQLDHLLSARPEARVCAWERDPWLLRVLLTRRDYSAALESGRLRFALCADLLDEIEPTSASAQGEGGAPPAVLKHPMLTEVYSAEAAFLEGAAPARHALLCRGTLFVQDVEQALVEQGLAAWTWDVERLSHEELARIAARLRPEFVVAVNYRNGLAEACEELGLRLVVWEIDPRTDRLRPLARRCPSAQVFTYRRAQVADFTAAGLERCTYLPLAANPEVRRPQELDPTQTERYASAISFVGASMVERGQDFLRLFLAGWARWKGGAQDAAEREGRERVETVLSRQREAGYQRNLVPELVREQFGDWLAAWERSSQGHDPVALVAEMAAAEKRVSWVSALGSTRIKVWGDEGWQFCEQHGARYMGSAGHRNELSRIYSATDINLDIGRLYQNDMVTMRVFDAMACGGFVLTERSDALSELFEPGVELDCYGSLEELGEKVGYWLDHPEERRAVARRGMEAVRAHHTIGARLTRMLEACAS